MSGLSELPAPVDHGRVIQWFEAEGRDLPWRRTRDPWVILVSELMLQQTQVQRVIERLPLFLDEFPTVRACAEASPGAVLTAWSGLGYNRRALSLHRTARLIVSDHRGVVPAVLDDLLALPGIGPYTSRAVRVFAFELHDAVVDTNVGRILARVHGRTLRPAAAQQLAHGWVPEDRPWAWNQALMEVGALLCRKAPKCGQCPLASECAWHSAGLTPPDPATGSAAVSKPQSRFAGSDRQGRGRLLRALQAAPVSESQLAAIMGWPDDPGRAKRVASGLTNDGMAVHENDSYRLP